MPATSRKLDNWLQAYLEYCEFSEAPESFHFWTGVSAIAGALRSHVWIDQRYFRWVPNFYIIFVAPPGIVSKSTTMSIGMKLLREVPGVKFGPDVVTWQSLVQSLAASQQSFNVGGKMIPMSAITIASSEFGTFFNPQDREMVDVLVSLWDGQTGVWEKATKTQGNDRIVNPWINMIAATTPAWIQENFPEYMIGGGFTSRTIFVYAERKRHLVAYPGDAVPEGHLKLRKDLIHDLEDMATNLKGPMELSPEAKDWGIEWYAKHHERLARTSTEERIAGYLARKQTHIHKLAMVLSASRSRSLTIELEPLQQADILITSIEDVLPRVFSGINTPDARNLQRLVRLVAAIGKAIPLDELFRRLVNTMSYEEFKRALTGALEAGLLSQYKVEGGKTVINATRRAREAS